MMSQPGNSNVPRWTWTPTKGELALFQEWKGILIGQLVSCKKGLLPARIKAMLKEQTGETIPFEKMGLKVPNIYQFLYQLRNDITLRRVDGRLYVFIEEYAVPPEMAHIREMVLHQNKGKTDKPLRHHGEYAPSIDLVRYTPQTFQSTAPGSNYGRPSRMSGRSGGAWGGGGGTSTTTARTISNLDIIDDDWGASSHRATTATRTKAPSGSYHRRPSGYGGGGPMRPRYLPGLMDEDEDDSDSDGFDFYSGVTVKPKSATPVDVKKVELVPSKSSSVTPDPGASVPPNPGQSQSPAKNDPIPVTGAKPDVDLPREVDQDILDIRPGQGKRFRTFSKLTGRVERVTSPSSLSSWCQEEAESKSDSGSDHDDNPPNPEEVVAEPEPQDQLKLDLDLDIRQEVSVEPQPPDADLPVPGKVNIDIHNILPGQGRRFRTFSKVTGRMELATSQSLGGQDVGPRSSATGSVGQRPLREDSPQEEDDVDVDLDLHVPLPASAAVPSTERSKSSVPFTTPPNPNNLARPPFKFPVYILEDSPETFKGYLKKNGFLRKYRNLLDNLASTN